MHAWFNVIKMIIQFLAKYHFKRSNIPIGVLSFFGHKMQKQFVRRLARSGRNTLLEILRNGIKMNRNVSLDSVFIQNVKGHTAGQQPLARAYSLDAHKTSNNKASKYVL